MSEEELQKKMEFIIEQQAQLVANQGKANERLTRLENVVVRLYEDTEAKLNALVDAQMRTEASVAALAEAQLRTDSKLAETDERLNSLITVVERYVSERRNGQSQG